MKTMTNKCKSCSGNYAVQPERGGNCVSVRRGGEQPPTEQTVRNDSELHLMSLDSVQPVKPSRFVVGEGRRGWARVNEGAAMNRARDTNGEVKSIHRHGGVSGGGTSGSGMVLSEDLPANALWATRGASLVTDKAALVCREVGAAHSSDEALVMRVERRGRSWLKWRQRSKGQVMACEA